MINKVIHLHIQKFWAGRKKSLLILNKKCSIKHAPINRRKLILSYQIDASPNIKKLWHDNGIPSWSWGKTQRNMRRNTYVIKICLLRKNSMFPPMLFRSISMTLCRGGNLNWFHNIYTGFFSTLMTNKLSV